MLRSILTSLSFYITLAIILAIITGGFPSHGNDIATIALILAMTFSIANIPFNIKPEDMKEFLYAFLLNYVLLSTIIIIMGISIGKYSGGFIVMAAAPPAVAIVPLSSILGGNKKQSLFSVLFLYIASIFIMPIMILFFFSREVSIFALLKNILLLIILPLLLSRPIHKKIGEEKIKIISNICFFFIVFSIVGENRHFLFEEVATIAFLSFLMALRTIGIGGIIKKLSEWKGVERERGINYTLFASFKNEGLVMIIASSLFGYQAAIPAMIALIFELILICCMESRVI